MLNATNCTENYIKNLNAVTLAFVGDAVHALYVRELLASKHTFKSGMLQKLAAQYQSAKGQAEQYYKIAQLLTEEEEQIFLRARNAKKISKSKSASVLEYNISTGYEAVLGYLYLFQRQERLAFLLQQAMDI